MAKAKNNPVPAPKLVVNPGLPDDASIGAQLRDAREQAGWTLEEAAKRTRLHREVIVQLESDAFDRLPSTSYARGFIRLYAKELKLDGWKLLRKLEGGPHDELELSDLQPEDLEAVPRRLQIPAMTSQSLGFYMLLGVIALALGIVGYSAYRVWPSFVTETAERAQAPLAMEPLPTDVEKMAADTTKKEIQPLPEIPGSSQPAKAEAVALPEGLPQAAPPKAEAPPAQAAAVAVHRLDLMADPNIPEEDRWVRVIAIQDGKETEFFKGIVPPGGVVPAPEAEPWYAEGFIITFREASSFSIIYNGNNEGKYPQSGIQTIRIPAAR
jgi:cytoskeleton protein RodZ